jgi:hypothetical protein
LLHGWITVACLSHAYPHTHTKKAAGIFVCLFSGAQKTLKAFLLM